ncbi:MAG: sigma-70 family RNA polymerase sigma factor [Lachnospiraceae bacterium]|jgi:RNA polymerase sigma-70 factor (ECF subfamily)|nr:sigma-70 family RNA polymerase sigma factor [Lachnospiraceae bacterium]
MKATEENFIALIRKRKEEGILYVIDTWGAYLQSIVRRRLFLLPDRVEECINDVFWGIWKNIDSYDSSKGSFQNWAAGIARFEAIDYLRRAQKEWQTVTLDGMDLSSDDQDMLALIEKELSEETKNLLSCLTPTDQELFLRIYGNEEDPLQVSSELGITRDNLYVRLFRGKKKMRAYSVRREENGL